MSTVPVDAAWSLALTNDDDHTSAHALVRLDKYLFCALRKTPGRLIWIPAADPNSWSETVFSSDGNHNAPCDMVPIGGQLYILFGGGMGVSISKVDPETKVITDVVRDAAQTAGGFAALGTDGVDLFVAASSSPAKVLRYSTAGVLLESVEITGFQSAHAIQLSGGKVFVTGNVNPAWISRLGTNPLRVEESLSFPVGYNSCTDDFTCFGGYAWVTFEGSPHAGDVMRVRQTNLSDQTLIPCGIGSSGFGVWNDGKYIWSGWAVTPDPRHLARINPSDLSFDYFSTIQSGLNEMAMDTERMYFSAFGVTPSSFYAYELAVMQQGGAAPLPPVNTAPKLTITQPVSGASIKCGSVQFKATALDAEDKDISARIKWDNGAIGAGTSINYGCGGPNLGTKTVKATVTDSGGTSTAASVTFTIKKK